MTHVRAAVVLVALCVPACRDEPTLVPAAGVPAPLSAADREALDDARALLLQGLPELVHERLAALLQREPVPAEAEYYAGQAAYGLARYEEAVERLGRAVALDRDQYLHQSNSLGFAHYKLGDFGAARRVFEAIVAVVPTETKALYGLGQLDLTEGRLDEARAHLTAVLELEPAHHRARFSLARALEAAGDDEAALQHVEVVVAAWPSHDEALFLLANLHDRAGRPQEAEAARARRAEVYAARETLAALQQRLRAGEDSPRLRLLMVETLAALGDVAQAEQLLAAARARFPGDPLLREAAERLDAAR